MQHSGASVFKEQLLGVGGSQDLSSLSEVFVRASSASPALALLGIWTVLEQENSRAGGLVVPLIGLHVSVSPWAVPCESHGLTKEHCSSRQMLLLIFVPLSPSPRE